MIHFEIICDDIVLQVSMHHYYYIIGTMIYLLSSDVL
jgi:hypothetical protein